MPGAEAVREPGVLGWLKSHAPTRASIARNRFLKPFAHRVLAPSLWRFNRRSVPRGVALGVLTGILFPLAHMPLAAVLALPFRANVPVAVSTTLLNNPITFGPILFTAYKIGRAVLRLDAAVPGQPLASNVHTHAGVLHWVAAGGPPIIVGLIVLASGLAAAGYVLTGLAWRLRIAAKWRKRRNRKG